MNNLDRFMEFFVAGVFFCGGLNKLYRLVRLRRKANALGVRHLPGALGMPYGWVIAIGLFEIAAALALVTPLGPWQPAALARLAAMGLALLMIFLAAYRVRRRQPSHLAFSLFFLAIFVIIGRL
jgi:hypothetical protein